MVLLLVMGSRLAAQAGGSDLSYLGKPFGTVLSGKGNPQALGREPGFLDAPAVKSFFGSLFDYFISCDDRYTFNSPILLDLVSRVSAHPPRTGFTILVYPGVAFWIDDAGKVAALEYAASQPLPPGLGSLASPEEARASLSPSSGRIEGWFRYPAPRAIPGSSEILVAFSGQKASRIAILSSSLILPVAWDWGNPSPGDSQGTP